MMTTKAKKTTCSTISNSSQTRRNAVLTSGNHALGTTICKAQHWLLVRQVLPRSSLPWRRPLHQPRPLQIWCYRCCCYHRVRLLSFRCCRNSKTPSYRTSQNFQKTNRQNCQNSLQSFLQLWRLVRPAYGDPRIWRYQGKHL